MKVRLSSNSNFKSSPAGLMAFLCGMLLVAQAAPNAPWAPGSAVMPKLRFAKSNDVLILSWPVSPFDFLVVAKSSLPGNDDEVWWPASQTYAGDEVRMLLPMTNNQRYFQLFNATPPVGSTYLSIFQFAVFGGVDLEMGFSPATTLTGPVHGNQNIYLTPENSLTFSGHVTTPRMIYRTNVPGDPRAPATGAVNYFGGHATNSVPLILPIGVSNTPAVLREILQPPTAGESPSSDMGQQRLYNKADLIVTVSDSGTTITSGLVDNKATIVDLASVPSAQRWLSTSTLYNRREAKTVQTIEIHVGNLVQWNKSTNNVLPFRMGTASRDVTIIHVDDKRSISTVSGSQSGVVVKNGQLLPPSGLTIVTPEPIYVRGHYNVQSSATNSPNTGSHDTTHTKPAALMGDSITILSLAWNLSDTAYGSNPWANRNAIATTVNAALLAGLVETTPGQYSGGLENFPRFLEDWSSDTFTYNGSMVILFPSQIATGLWQGSGEAIGIYNPPARDWSFDFNFNDPSKLPPGAPSVGVLAQPY